MKKGLSRLLRALVVILVVCGGAVPVDTQSQIPIYEYRYGSLEDFLYTANTEEVGGAPGWYSLGIEMYVYNSQQEGTVPFYRFYSPVFEKHFYSANFAEVGYDEDWDYEGVTGYVYPYQETGTVAIRRWHKWVSGGPVHIYATSTADDSLLYENGWEFEGVAGYAFAP